MHSRKTLKKRWKIEKKRKRTQVDKTAQNTTPSLDLRGPVHGVQHFDHHQHRQRHRHGLRVGEDGAVNALEAGFLCQALRLVRLERGAKGREMRAG